MAKVSSKRSSRNKRRGKRSASTMATCRTAGLRDWSMRSCMNTSKKDGKRGSSCPPPSSWLRVFVFVNLFVVASALDESTNQSIYQSQGRGDPADAPQKHPIQPRRHDGGSLDLEIGQRPAR